VTSCSTGSAWAVYIFYQLFNCWFNMFLLYITKHMSGVWAAVGTVLCLDLCNIMSSFEFIMGPSANPMDFSMWVGTFVATLGLWAYNMTPELNKQGESVYTDRSGKKTEERKEEELEEYSA